MHAVPGRTQADGPPVFVSVYQTHDEWVTELTNRTVHSLMHLELGPGRLRSATTARWPCW